MAGPACACTFRWIAGNKRPANVAFTEEDAQPQEGGFEDCHISIFKSIIRIRLIISLFSLKFVDFLSLWKAIRVVNRLKSVDFPTFGRPTMATIFGISL